MPCCPGGTSLPGNRVLSQAQLEEVQASRHEMSAQIRFEVVLRGGREGLVIVVDRSY